SGFWLVDALGLPGTLRVAGGLNLVIAATVWFLARGVREAPLAGAPRGAEAARLLLAAAFLTGAASFFYEIGWIRMLSLVLGASTHSFELMLATFIFGLALGGLAVRRRVDSGEPLGLLAAVQVLMGLAALATLPVYDASFSLMETLMQGLARSDTGYRLFNLSGALVSALVMLPATVCAGMTLPLLTAALARRDGGERAIGQVYAANTLGAIAGVIAAVHVGLPALGLKGTLAAGAAIDMALGLVLLREAGARLGFPAALCLGALGAAAFGVELD